MLLLIYNICGISGYQNAFYYVDAIKSLLRQQLHVPFKIAISSCLSTARTEQILKENLGDAVIYNWIEESLPLPHTFNHTVQKCVEHFSDVFSNFGYFDSGVNLHDPSNQYDALSNFYKEHTQNKNIAISAAMPSNDDGRQWWDIQYPWEDDPHYNGNYIFPVGKTTNLHCQLYTNEFRKAYNGRIIPDIFANDTSESVTTFMTAAIRKQFQMVNANRIHVFHSQNMDGASIGWRGQNQDGTVRLFNTEKTMDQRFFEGYEFGFGYEECKPRWLHDSDKFNVNGFAKDERLLPFLKKELFLSKEEFNYEAIQHRFEP